MNGAKRAWCLAGSLCAFVVLADQVSKAAIERNLVPGEQVDVLGPLELTLAHNSGIAFGLAGGAGVPLIMLTLAALGFVGFLFYKNPTRPWAWLALGLVAGGAIGNLIDRVRAGEVTDFIELPSWPAFNFADVAITVGILLLVLLYLRDDEGGRGGRAEGERADA